MAKITLGGNPIETVGSLPTSGKAPSFTLHDAKLEEVSLSDFAGHKVVLNIIPSVDTGVCAKSARTFNERAAALDGARILTVSRDLPFALGRFCAAEGIDEVVMLSGFRSEFGQDYEVTIKDGPFADLYSRAIVVLDADHQVVYTQQVSEIGDEPDYDAALSALEGA